MPLNGAGKSCKNDKQILDWDININIYCKTRLCPYKQINKQGKKVNFSASLFAEIVQYSRTDDNLKVK